MSDSSSPPRMMVGLAHESFTLTLDKIIHPPSDTTQPSTLPSSLECEFSYVWNFPRKTGSGYLLKVGSVEMEIPLAPMGIKDEIDFMSTEPSTVRLKDGSEVVLERVVLDLKDGERMAAVVLVATGGGNGVEGGKQEEILATQNWREDAVGVKERKLPDKVHEKEL